MIVQVAGTLLTKALDRVEIMTAGGVAYELQIPLNVYETLPRPGEPAMLYSYLVVKEDGWQLFGFSNVFERQVFHRVLGAKGVGPALALGMLSALSAERVVRAIRDKDIVTLQSVPRVGRKKAEQLILDLADKLDDIQAASGVPGARRIGMDSEAPGADDAIRALVALGYSSPDAERAVRTALDDGARGMNAPELIRRALAKVGGR